MRVRTQVTFFVIVFALIAAIVFLGIYSNGMKRYRGLEKAGLATWGDVLWRLEEKNKILSNFLTVLDQEASFLSSGSSQAKGVAAKLDAAIKNGDKQAIIQYSNELDLKLRELLGQADGSAEVKKSEAFLSQRKALFDIEGTVVSDRAQYNEAVERYNRFIKGFPGRLIARRASAQILFHSSRGSSRG